MEIRILHCALCWGYRARALAVAEVLRKDLGAQVEVTAGKLGQFDVFVDGELILSRGTAAARLKPTPLPDAAKLIAAVKRRLSNSGEPRDPAAVSHAFGPEEAKRFYDRFASMQDLQFYERAPLHNLIAHADFEHASSVLELGCGTGRFAARLLEKHLPRESRYLGIDISTSMIELASRRLARWSDRAEIHQADATRGLPFASQRFDRVVSTYVFDLLPSDKIDFVLREAHRVLRSEGKLCLVASTQGNGSVSRLIGKVWKALYERNPSLVGGCRPISVASLLDPSAWQLCHTQILSSFGITSEVVVASPIG